MEGGKCVCVKIMFEHLTVNIVEQVPDPRRMRLHGSSKAGIDPEMNVDEGKLDLPDFRAS